MTATVCFSATIESPRITSWGQWTNWMYCPTDWYVIGMQLKVESKQGNGDDTALNGIKLFCASLGSLYFKIIIFTTYL